MESNALAIREKEGKRGQYMAFIVILIIVAAVVSGVNTLAIWILCGAVGLSLLPSFLQHPVGSLMSGRRSLPRSDEAENPSEE